MTVDADTSHGRLAHNELRGRFAVNDVPGLWALRPSFVYPDGFQMQVSDPSSAERWRSSPAARGLGQQA